MAIGGAPARPAQMPGGIDNSLDWRKTGSQQWERWQDSIYATIRTSQLRFTQFTVSATFASGTNPYIGATLMEPDSGAYLLGLLVAVSTSVVGGRADPTTQAFSGQTYFFLAPLAIPLIILGVPILDVAFATGIEMEGRRTDRPRAVRPRGPGGRGRTTPRPCRECRGQGPTL
jgi:hypothetical protein